MAAHLAQLVLVVASAGLSRRRSAVTEHAIEFLGARPNVVRWPWRYLLEHDLREIERRLKLYPANSPKAIAADLGVHPNTFSKINLGRHHVQQRLSESKLATFLYQVISTSQNVRIL